MQDLLPDLCDAHAEQLTLLQAPLRDYGGKTVFFGEVVTVSCFEDNSRVKEVLATPGHGKVLVVDGCGSLNRALMGDVIAETAVDNQWRGVIVLGAIRDVGAIAELPLGVKALGACPFKTDRKGAGSLNVELHLDGVAVRPGQWVYADGNGVVFSNEALPFID
ncbi:putative 4-hydroxy-4-methyl-2-oxoglutarate aldolase [Gallaecimonas sp. GXIMD1310]|uniref:putative 4-hydroxy-4-methyl-2-oxoglutarate aldolase n=1 Tax=Gallaecimonas sp. GXIMD1310 TaxID=3131926 RepID=UPI0032453E69